MSEEYDWEVYEVFKEEMSLQLDNTKEHIHSLSEKELVYESINTLFRTYHSYKATSHYLSLLPIHKLSSRVEDVLSSMRDAKETVDNSIIEWLLKVNDQFLLWIEDLNLNKTVLQDAPLELFEVIKVSPPYMKPEDKLRRLNILYLDHKISRSQQITSMLKNSCASLEYTDNIPEAEVLLENTTFHIVIANLSKDNERVLKFMSQNFENTPILIIYDKVSSSLYKKLFKSGITHILENPLKARDLQREVLSITKAYHSSQNILMSNKNIDNFINNLEPLANTIFQVISICEDEESSIKELIKVVSADSIMAGYILDFANNPIYGKAGINTLDKAVIKIGTKAVKALCMAGIYKNLYPIDLSAYNIDEDIFSKVSQLRLSLMLKWYAKVSISSLSILSSTALLGNLGQLLISKEIISLKQESIFKEITRDYTISYAEESIIRTTTNTISSQILRYWKIPLDIVEVITYSDNPLEAPKEIRKLCIANHIVYSLIDIKGNISQKISSEILSLMNENGLEIVPLQKALESILPNNDD